MEFKPYALKYGEQEESAVYSFKNIDPKAENLSFYMLNDIHDRPNSIRHLMRLRPQDNPDFVFFNGDIFDYQTDEKQIFQHFINPCVEQFASEKPFLFVRGNHETRGKYARELPQYFKKVGYAAFSIGSTRFIILDTGEDKKDDTPVYAGIVNFDEYRAQQAALLEEEIKSPAYKKATFKVVMMHIPPRFSGDWHGPLECTRLFEPLLNQGKVDLVLSGHIHEFKIHQPHESSNEYALVIGGGSKEGQRTLTRTLIIKKQLKVEVYNNAGKLIGEYSKSKTAKKKKALGNPEAFIRIRLKN